MPDHGQIHRVRRLARAALAERRDPVGGLFDRRSRAVSGHLSPPLSGNPAPPRPHSRRTRLPAAPTPAPFPHRPLPYRGTLGSPRPAVAISSRWISLTPPPKVSTVFRLA